MGTTLIKLAPILLLSSIAILVVFVNENYVSPNDTGIDMHSVTYISDPFVLDRMYGSMMGPYKVHPITISNEFPSRMVWLTGLDFTATDSEGNPLENQAFLCHGQVRYEDPKLYASKNEELFESDRSLPAKWFTVIQGQSGIQFPSGFGIPMMSNEPLEAMTMVINQMEGVAPVVLKMKTKLSYVYEDVTSIQMKPLGKFVVDIRVPIEDSAVTEGEHPDNGAYSTTCAIDEFDNVVTAQPFKKTNISKRNGQNVTFHFMVPPGRQTYRYQFEGSDYLAYETTVHHISAHLHVYGESLEIIDVTDGTSQIFRSVATANPDMQYIENMTEWSSEEGIAFFPDHTYEVKAVYNNTTEADIDAMAVMYFYYHDKAFERGQLVRL